jgi:O-antigen ligase
MAYFLGLILALLPTYLIRFQILGLPTTFLELLIVVFLFAAVVQTKWSDYKKIKSLGKINYAIGLFILAGIASTLISPDKRAALGQLKAFIIEPVLFFYASILVIKTREQLNLILKFLLASATLLSIFGLIQYVTYILLPLRFWGTGTEVERITSFFSYPNALALYLAPLIGFYISLWLKKYELGMKHYVLPVCLTLMSIALVLTFSRGALLAVILIGAVLFIQRFGFKKTLAPMFLLAIILVLVPVVRQRIALGLNDASSTTHFDLWKVASNKILSNPILGTGLAGFQAYDVQYPHDIFLNFWLEMGLLGLISFGGILIFAFEHKKIPSSLILAAGAYLLIMLLHGLVDVPYFKNDLAVLFWFMISIFYLQIPETKTS